MINPLCVPKGISMFCVALLSGLYLVGQTNVKSTTINSSSALTSISLKGQPLNIGDKAPNFEFTLIDYPARNFKLSDFYGKLVILDFWATWCSPCLKSFSKLDSFQKEFNDRLQILLVNSKNSGDDKKKVINFFEKKRNTRGEKYNLSSIVEDTLLNKLFPHYLIPHYVWIAPDGTVMAITSSEHVTADNIKKSLGNELLELPIKKDIDIERPLFSSDNLLIDDLMHYSIFIKGKLDGLPSGDRLRKSGEVIRGRAITNTTILTMYEIAISQQMKDYRFNHKRMVLEIIDSSKLILDETKSDKGIWNRENLYTYDLIVPVSEAERLYNYILDDLNRYTNYYGKIEKRATKCLVLIRTSKFNKIKTRGDKQESKLNDKEKRYLKNAPISHLIAFLNGVDNIELPIVDETYYPDNIDIKLPFEITDINVLRKALQNYDLDLIQQERKLDMFILTEKKHGR